MITDCECIFNSQEFPDDFLLAHSQLVMMHEKNLERRNQFVCTKKVNTITTSKDA